MSTSSAWATTNEAARDLHRTLLEEAGAPRPQVLSSSQSAVDLGSHELLYPGVGTASQLARPGGFRRAFVGGSSTYAQRPLVAHITRPQATTPGLTGFASQTMADGRVVYYESRGFRIGHLPVLRRGPSQLPEAGDDDVPPLVLCAIRPRSLPYWTAVNFLLGSILFTFGSFSWMLPDVGDTEHGAPAWASALTVSWPFFIGSLYFTVGCYLALVVAINANLHEELRKRVEGRVAPERASNAASTALLPTAATASVADAAATDAAATDAAATDAAATGAAATGAATNATVTAAANGAAASPQVRDTPPAESLHASARSPSKAPSAELTAEITAREGRSDAVAIDNRPVAINRPPDLDLEAELALPLDGSLHSRGSSARRQRRLASSRGEAVDETEIEAALKLVPTDRCCHTRRIRWWAYQPFSAMYWGVVAQLTGSLLFNVACAAGLPGVLPDGFAPLESYLIEAGLEWAPSVVGSSGFVLASYVYLAEVTHSYHPCALPKERSVGYAVCVLNLVGSLLFLVASLCYFARPVPPSHAPGPGNRTSAIADASSTNTWEWEVSEWGVRFTFGVGSGCFLLGAVGAIAEVLNDADPLAILRSRAAAARRASQAAAARRADR